MTRQEIYEKGKSLLSFAHWRNRLVFWCGAIIIGIIGAGFSFIADGAQVGFLNIIARNEYLPLLVCPLILGLTAWLTSKFAPGAVGSGIPQAIAARSTDDPKERMYLLGPQIILGKVLLTALALLGGASIGREGPTVQVGATILYLGAVFMNMNPDMRRNVILAGAAAGIAAAFNTPLAGIVFAIEEMARAFETRYSGVVLTAIVLAGAASLSILGNYSYFGAADGAYLIARDWFAIGVVGVIGGLTGGLFALLLSQGGFQLNALRQKIKFVCHPAIFAALCGLIIAALGLLTHGATYGTGYTQAKDLLHNATPGSWLYTISKFIATIVSGFSGIPGGIFSPSLSVGAGLGASMASWFPATPIAGMVLLGMTAYFSGVTQAPITAFIIVLEITGRLSLPFPLIAASVIAAAISRRICPVSLYHALAKTFIVEKVESLPEELEVS